MSQWTAIPLWLVLLYLFCAGATPAAIQNAQQGPVTFSVQYDAGRVYDGSAVLSIDAAGAVTGRVSIERPVLITADFVGQVADGRLVFDHSYVLGNCTGRMTGTGAVESGSGAIRGDVEIGGPCVPQPLKGTFTMIPQEGEAADAVGRVRWEPYQLQTDSGPMAADLGRIRVPERRRNPSSRRIEVAFARIRSTAANPASPIVYLDGGPGGSGIGAARVPAFAALFRALANVADVILVSQRGTGLSDRIGCRDIRPLPEDAFTSASLMTAAVTERQAACAQSLRAQGVDIAAYNSEESADDIDAIRAALGVPRISLLGFSYGTHLALATIRRHDERIERVVMLGTEGPDQTWKLPATFDTQVAAIDALVTADPRARERMPDFEGALRALLAKADAAPLNVTIDGGGGRRTFHVGASGLLFLLRRDIGDSNDIPWIPAFVYDTLGGRTGMLEQLLVRRLPQLESGVNMMATAMDCASGASDARLAEIRRQESESIFGGFTNFPFPEVCQAAGIPMLGDTFRAPVTSRASALFISGTLDSNTPPSQAEAAMRGFKEAAHLVVEGAGHESMMIPTVGERIIDFLAGRPVKSERLRGERLAFKVPGAP